MDASISLTKANVSQEEIDTIVAKAKQWGWTVTWHLYGTE